MESLECAVSGFIISAFSARRENAAVLVRAQHSSISSSTYSSPSLDPCVNPLINESTYTSRHPKLEKPGRTSVDSGIQRTRGNKGRVWTAESIWVWRGNYIHSLGVELRKWREIARADFGGHVLPALPLRDAAEGNDGEMSGSISGRDDDDALFNLSI